MLPSSSVLPPQSPQQQQTLDYFEGNDINDGFSDSSHGRRESASVNALSLSFVATAVLISLFLLMAIFDRFLRPIAPSPEEQQQQQQQQQSPPSPHSPPPSASPKHSRVAFCEYVSGMSVIMPGHDFPTYIAKPAPLQVNEPEDVTRTPATQHLGKASCVLDVSSASADICSLKLHVSPLNLRHCSSTSNDSIAVTVPR